MQPVFDEQEGVLKATVGYAGGTKEDATYKRIGSGKTDHHEAIQIAFDPKRISYRTLLEFFFASIDPSDPGGQFVDRGNQYKTAVFYHDVRQKKDVESYITELKNTVNVVTPVKKYTTFFPAEDYHQDYAKKHPIQYGLYKKLSGR